MLFRGLMLDHCHSGVRASLPQWTSVVQSSLPLTTTGLPSNQPGKVMNHLELAWSWHKHMVCERLYSLFPFLPCSNFCSKHQRNDPPCSHPPTCWFCQHISPAKSLSNVPCSSCHCVCHPRIVSHLLVDTNIGCQENKGND